MHGSVDIMHRALSLSMCRSLRFIYLFRALFGPDLFGTIVHEHRLPNGAAAVEQKWPTASSLVHTVVLWVEMVSRWQNTGQKRTYEG